MRSAIHTTFGEPADVLELGDRQVPQPGAGEVRIKTSLAPIHNHDLWTIRGRYGYKPELPAIGGSEAVGIVDALGEGVEGVTVGQRVAVASVHGTWAEYFLAPARLLVPRLLLRNRPNSPSCSMQPATRRLKSSRSSVP